MIGAGMRDALVASLAALWLVIAFAATFIGMRRAARGAQAVREARVLGDLLAASPAVPLLVHGDGALDADPRLAAWLGRVDPPHRIEELAAGLDPDSFAGLQEAVASSLAGGRPLHLRVVLAGGARQLDVRGGPYSVAGVDKRSLLLWFLDLSDAHEEIARLTDKSDRLGRALEGLSALIEAAPFPMWHRGPDLALALVNRAYVRAVEASGAEEVVIRGMELIENNGSQGPQENAAEARARGTIAIRTAPAIVSGQRRMMRVVDVPIGQSGVAGYAIDVQDLEEARAALELFVRAQRDMLDRLTAGVVQFGADQGLVFYNRHFLRLFELSPEWLADRPEFDRVLERMRETQRAPESRDFRTWRADRRQWFAATEAVEETWLLPGGTHLRVVAQPLPDRGLLLIFEDRTEHLQLASARDTLVRVRAATFDSLFEAIGVFAADGRLHLWNNRFREVWDLAEEELARHPRVDALVQTIAPKLLDPTRAGLIRDLVRIATVERQHRSGRISLLNGRHFEFAAVPLPDGNALFTLLDITASRGIEEALRDRNEALEEANSLKSAFVASMSYELRVPLTSIAGFAEMLAGGYAGPLEATAQEYVQAILTAVGRLSTLMGNVLDLTQSEAGSLPMAMEAVEVAELARSSAERAVESARSAGLTLVTDVAGDSGIVSGDRRRLAQVLDHLLRNAVTYTPPGGRVLVRSRIVDGMAEMVVSDNGGGIPTRERERIFDRFRRGSMALVEQEEEPRAMGLGLPLARQLVEAHGGTLLLLSEVGRGTSVIVRLPLALQDAA